MADTILRLFFSFAVILACIASLSAFAQQGQKIYTKQERRAEEERIRHKIEERLNWKARAPEKPDDVPDQDRLLIGGLNESILLHQSSGERFGLFEGFSDSSGVKTIEIRFHRKNKLTDRFSLYSADLCDQSVDISADKVRAGFVVYTTTCSSKKYGPESSPYLFDYASRNLYQLAVLDYDPIKNSAPDVKQENGIYKMRWNVRLRGASKNTLIIRNFKIVKGSGGSWEVKELAPTDDEAANIAPLPRLPLRPEYGLPS